VPCIDRRIDGRTDGRNDRRHGLLLLAALSALAASGCGQAQPLRAGAGRADPQWEAFQRRAAQRLVAANPKITYAGEVPAELLAIPILDIELERDGSVKRINVKRTPANPAVQDTVKIAIDAVRRAAPYGDVSALAAPWIWTEVFLFNDKRQFKPRTLDD
jgi:protein TonB